MKKKLLLLYMAILFIPVVYSQSLQVKTVNGIVKGVDESGIRSFKGVPFAAPPVGNLRWREPQPVKNWEGIRKADKFGPRAMQLPLYSDMKFRSDGMSEDCLYLNVWTPAKSGKENLPVLVYFYGGGLMTGDGSEFRYDGASMSRKGIVVVTVNYRVGIFGFFNHPELTKESPHHACGNYGLLDQVAALRWVHKNIAAFGGDPAKVTIAGESAGSSSVSVQMASPLSKTLIGGAIGESGAVMGKNATSTLSEAEKKGVLFADSIGATSLAALRALSADSLLQATARSWYSRFPITVDGYFLPKDPATIYQAGEQAHIPLLAGWNSAEVSYQGLLGQDEPNEENYKKAVQKKYEEKAGEVLIYYSAATDDQVPQAATDLASDKAIGFETWKWTDLQANTGGHPVYRYLYCRPRPAIVQKPGDVTALSTTKALGAGHSWEIEYALGNLPTNRVYDWQPEDYKVSEIMQAFFANFIKTGNPNGIGVPVWPTVKSGGPAPVMNIDVHSKAETEEHRDRYLFINKWLLM